MRILLPALAVAFAVFCVWLMVRIINRRERWAKWTLAMVVGMPVLYVLTFGPAVWITARRELRDQVGQSFIEFAYRPLLFAICNGPSGISQALYWWGELGIRNGRQVFFDVDASREGFVWFGLRVKAY